MKNSLNCFNFTGGWWWHFPQDKKSTLSKLNFSSQIAKAQIIDVLLPIYGQNEAKAIANRLIVLHFNIALIDILTDKPLTKPPHWESTLFRLSQGEPFQYVIEKEFFHDNIFKINQNTLIPRPETEELVDWILEDNKEENLKIVDIGTGSGVIPISLSAQRSSWEIEAWDISEKALEMANWNAENIGATIHFQKMDALAINSQEKFDIIVSNPPYVANFEKKEMKDHVLKYEPELALFVEDHNPLIFYQKIMEFGEKSLNPNGKIYFEINPLFLNELEELIHDYSYSAKIRNDFRGKQRMLRICRN